MKLFRLVVPIISCLLLIPCVPGASAQEARRLAGIEIGSKSVKATVLELAPGRGPRTKKLYEQVFPTNLTANLIETKEGRSFNTEAIARTVNEATKARNDIVKNYGDRVECFLVASSGVCGAVRAESLNTLDRALAANKDLPRMDRLSPDDEVLYTFLGVVEEDVRDSTLSFDIGSGNTKFGYVIPGRADDWQIINGEIKFGSNTLVADVTKILGADDVAPTPERLSQFEAVATKFKEDNILPAMRKKFEDKPGLWGGARQTVYMTGGIVWAMVSLERPEVDLERSELKADKRVRVDGAMLKNFARRVRSDDPFRVDPNDERAVRKARAVRAVFSRQQLLAGAVILDASADVLGIGDDGGTKLAYFCSDGLFAWIKGYTEKNSLPDQGHQKAILNLFQELNQRLEILTGEVATGFKGIKPAPPTDLSSVTTAITDLKGQLRSIEQELIAIRKVQGKSQSAEPIARRDPDKAWYNFHRGVATYRNKDFPKAQAHFLAAIGEDREEPAFWYGLALSQFSLCDREGLMGSAGKLVNFQLQGDPFDKMRYNHFFMYIQGVDRQTVDQCIKTALDEARLKPGRLSLR